MTLSKLSQRNAKRQARDYLVYFVTIVLSAALMYAFNGLVASQEVITLSANMAAMPFVIVFASLIVVGIIGWLVAYTTRFMLKRRSRELGTYILLGMENKQVAQLFFRENLIVGGIALAVGILLGGLLYQGLRAVVLALFGVGYTFSLGLSPLAIGLTLLYFALIYLLALRKNKKRIRGMKIYDLIYLERQNEEESVKSGAKRKGMFTVSLVCGLAGVALLMMGNVLTGFLGTALVIVFLFCFFLSFSSGVPAFFNKRPQKKYKGTNLLVFRSLSSKLTTMGVTMAVVALLFTTTIIAEGAGLLFNNQFERRAELYTSFDLLIGTPHIENGLDAYHSYIEEHSIPVRDSYEYTVYMDDNSTITNYVASIDTGYIRDYDGDTLMRASDYAALREMLGYPAVELPSGGYIIHGMEYLDAGLRAWDKPLTIGGAELQPAGVYTEDFSQYLWRSNGRGFILIVPDTVAESCHPENRILGIMMDEPLAPQDYWALREIDNAIYMEDQVLSKAAVREENANLYATIVFPLFYLALVLTMVAATILTTQLLSDSNRYKQQFDLMHKLGMSKKDMQSALRRQFILFYAMPAAPAVIISVALLGALSGAFDSGIMVGILHQVAVVGLAFVIFFAIYLVYIIASYTSFKRNVLPLQANHKN